MLGLLANNTEYSFSISSREGHEVSNITLTQSPNAAANQLDIFEFVATSALDANMSALSV